MEFLQQNSTQLLVDEEQQQIMLENYLSTLQQRIQLIMQPEETIDFSMISVTTLIVCCDKYTEILLDACQTIESFAMIGKIMTKEPSKSNKKIITYGKVYYHMNTKMMFVIFHKEIHDQEDLQEIYTQLFQFQPKKILLFQGKIVRNHESIEKIVSPSYEIVNQVSNPLNRIPSLAIGKLVLHVPAYLLTQAELNQIPALYCLIQLDDQALHKASVLLDILRQMIQVEVIQSMSLSWELPMVTSEMIYVPWRKRLTFDYSHLYI